MSLGFNVAFHHLLRKRIERTLTRDEQHFIEADGLSDRRRNGTVRETGHRGISGYYDGLRHQEARLSGVDFVASNTSVLS
ncbi:hypothetical protein ACQ5SK_12130 [Bradyrhizobium japonicum]